MVWEGWGRHVFFSRCHPVVSQNHGSAARLKERNLRDWDTPGNVRFGSISCSVATWTQIYWRRAPQLAGVDRKGEVEASFSKEYSSLGGETSEMSWLPKKEVVWKNAMNLLREEVIICLFGWELLLICWFHFYFWSLSKSRVGAFFDHLWSFRHFHLRNDE